ncbi:hypothetical protein [Pseudodesulfovibrio sediminis]|uniref:Uncharacterized protein n=1 Tax=Pseudodesulfovibrio sediminis TaxID=2810563 RepID=A0ABM7P904_9BACT|nr:hypothetical protein [Pseudodesulfovibrio sediminis]BCS89399.1 hypothetical protein PSDVSF_26410 [Pseudodesulfovibrio sediminis]
MNDPKKEKRGEINGMSYGKIMTSLLIPKNARSDPKRILSGIAFLVFICFFLFAALSKGCQRETLKDQQQEQSRSVPAIVHTRSV